ncbi:uncharacterized protein LOC110846895 [Folsomia candida]|uniref:uncharacterized protein LOC110846895 n=1 Tax=Folsomia candida TaxID=158441 RepID=UPI001604B0F9|nr:uncharacterized protein LOC110846895 [Folsomia candida]
MRLVCGESKIPSPCHCPGILLLGLALQCSVLMTVGIRLENVTVPSVAIIGQSVGLECQYRLEDDKLYSLKWYKNDQEFFRYSPNSRPNIVTFQTHGVQVDNQELHNHPNRVTLRSLSLNSSGLFRCEVVSESPVFQTVFKERKLNVIIPPNPGNPHLSKFSPTIHMYEILTGNCTSYKSYPAANLTFYINERKWGSPNVTEYESVKEIDREGKEVWTSVIGLRVRVDNNFFNKGAIRIKCKASILGREWITSKNITHQNKNYQHPLYSSARNQYSSASRIRWCHSSSWTFPLFSISAIFSSLYILYFTSHIFNPTL